ncbi:MAG TPA: prephenate dehydrogenase/arogenate dehydrogenase family protein [Acidimicrobiales bacterium]|nr:prephenate dehydrogenase/arogenate dehydrogenase family protein [Acidimicrobiales bacterium]
MTSPTEPGPRPGGQRVAGVVGTGLIGGSIGLSLRRRGWRVIGRDCDPDRAARALELGALDEIGDPAGAEVTFVATPVASVVQESKRALATSGIVTDVAGVKASVVAAVDDPHFVGGHPMAGSEQVGVEGSDPDLFEGATWVLTPTVSTDPSSYARLRSIVADMGANVVAVSPEDHDALVAVVSHVPHLTAAALMTLAADQALEHASLLRLAAGGFRDMTRIAAGHPGIWPDIVAENRSAILQALDRLMASLATVHELVAEGNGAGLLEVLERAHVARRNLPARAVRPEDLVELRVPVPDRPGALAEVTTLASELGINIEDLTIAHSAEGDRGIMLLVVDARHADLMRGALFGRGFRPSAQPL